MTRIIWFGSWINGYLGPGSDLDICLVVSHTGLLARDRLPNYLPAGYPVGLDLLVYTADEFDQLGRLSPG
jgi:predicted nucleotidyltransferase